MENLHILILAAGKGTRMKSKKAKVLHEVAGATLLEHVMRAARSLDSSVTVVAGYQGSRIRALAPAASFVDQPDQLGTGHAAACARPLLADFAGDLLVLPGDVPLVGPETLRQLIQSHRDGGFVASVLTAELPNPSGYGRIVRSLNRGELERIVEHRDATADELKIAEINSGIYVFHSPSLFEALSEVRNDNAQSEYYLTDVIGILTRRQRRVGAFKAGSPTEILGINTRQELAAVDRTLRLQKCEALMSEGVTIVDPESTFIDLDVRIGADTVIHPSVQIHGPTEIGEDVTIHSFCRIAGSTIAARSVLLEGCIVDGCSIGEDVSVGPYAHLRMQAALANSVKVGNFVEIKKSSLGEGTKSMHLTYLGDATIGRNVNIGAGTITCNYDGRQKHPTTIEDDVFIGSDSQLIAPVRIGNGAYVGAGSSITDDVPAESLALARGRQVVKEGWSKKKK